MDEYHISDIPSRFIMAQHYHSSMDEPNLDNVEAKLNVARQKNHDLALEYFRNKYGSTVAYDEFVKHHNMGEVTRNVSKRPEEILRGHLERKAREIEKHFYNEEEFSQNEPEEKEPEWIQKPTTKAAKNNPWVQSNKQGHKQEGNEPKYIDSAIAPKDKQSNFISEFKNYLENKEKPKESNESNFNKTTNSKFEESKVAYKQAEVPKRRCYEEELAKKIFKDISGSNNDETKIEKLSLVEHILKNKKILKVFGFSETDLNNQIMKEVPTSEQDTITLSEFTYFILKIVGKEKEINELKQEKKEKLIPQGCMLSKEIIFHFEKVFQQLDVHTDLIIQRLPFIERLANDPFISDKLNSPAVYETQLDKTITLRRIFERIEMERIFGSEEQQKIKEYISWNEFLDYFRGGSDAHEIYDIVALIDSLHKSSTLGLLEVPQTTITLITEAIQKVPSRSGYYNVYDLISEISKHPDFQTEKYTEVRFESKMSDLPSEALEDVLIRMKRDGQKFMNLKEFLEYFSIKGRPYEEFETNRQSLVKKNFSGVKIRQVENEIIQKNEDIDGYDSDPEIYQSKMNKNSPKKAGRSILKNEHSHSFLEESKAKSHSQKKEFKVTVPIPFTFDERDKNKSKVPLERIEESSKVFKAKEIPSKVLDNSLYSRMLEEDQKRIEERKKSSMIMTLANEKPFNFMNRGTNKKNKEERESFVFKAKPIPWYCSLNLLEKKKESEIVRNEKIAKEAQESLAKAKLPPRMERDFQQKQAKMALEEHEKEKKHETKTKVFRDPPDFDKLHREFEEGLERKRKENKTTKPQEFNFAQRGSSRPKTAIPSHTQGEFFNENQTKIREDSYKKHLEPKLSATSTAKFQQQVEKRREEMEKKRKEEQQKLQEEEKRQKIDEELKSKLIAATKIKENKEKEERDKKEKEMKEQMKSFQEWKKSCVEKGRQQPMLIERPLKRDEKIEKMKKLYQISQTLKTNGIKGKEHDTYFKREELLMLQDWEQLKDRI